MIETVQTILYFIAAIVILIGFHEYGHFIVARKLGFKVEKFSIGFGPSLFSWRGKDGEVEYVIAAIPLGGYVKMFGENPYDQVDSEEKVVIPEKDLKRAFNRQAVWKRALVAFAGPAFNFIFAIVAFAIAGLLGREVLPANIGTVVPNSVAEQKGLQFGDEIVALNGQEVGSWQAFEEYLKFSVGEEVVLDVARDQHVKHVTFTLPIPEKDVFLIDVASTLLGVALGMDILIESVMPDSPAEQALLKAGDKIIAVNGKPVYNISTLIGIVGDSPDKRVNLQVIRDGSQLQLRVTPKANNSGRGLIGVRLQAKPWDEHVWQHKGLFESIGYGFTRTWEVTVMTGEMIKRMITASISADNIGGPIAIAQMAGSTASSGLVYFVMFLAFFSVNLAILNLLPIPVLDGGMLMFLALEQVRGKPLSVDMQVRFQAVGMLLIMALMVFAFYNDIMRLF
ncbi:MAG TPA: RIP metalloprotease RseP [Ghiorsea sp.]|nr:RIP metalloprotease RseP [Ghiorsea sp.]HIP07046.1 RIP metalloprotease RseP [Mariprofundaceae bacterium]